jgi:sugar phosphate isomerase/epimerase
MMKLHEEVFGTKIMGVGDLPLEYRESPETVQKFIDEVNEIGKKIAPYGFKFTYHNHHFEFLKFDNGKTMMDMLYEGLDPETVSFCLDTHWVERGGGCVVSWIEKLAGRLDILHLKDMGVYRGPNGAYDIQPRIVAVGDGNLDWKDIIAAAEKAGVKHFCVEYDTPEQPMEALRKSAEYLHANFMK